MPSDSTTRIQPDCIDDRVLRIEAVVRSGYTDVTTKTKIVNLVELTKRVRTL